MDEKEDGARMPRRLFRKVVQQGRSERRGDAYPLWYGEPLSDARTLLANFINGLLAKRGHDGVILISCQSMHPQT